MTHSITRARPQNPMWYFERNYNVLIGLIQQSQLLEQGRVEFDLSGTRIILSLLENSRYTLLLGIQQIFLPGEQSGLLTDLHFKVRIYLDARLAEVVSYQGQQPLEPRYPFPNKRMFYPDEKRQTNLVLYDWLSNCSRLNYMGSIALNYQN